MYSVGCAGGGLLSRGATYPGLAARVGAGIATMGAALYVGYQLDGAIRISEAQPSGADEQAMAGDH